MAAVRFVGMDNVVADPAAGRFRGLRCELLVRRNLTPFQWLPKPASRWFPENRLSLRDQSSPSEGEKVARRPRLGRSGILPVIIRFWQEAANFLWEPYFSRYCPLGE